MPPPLLSVVIPTHNRPQFLPRAIDSALQAAPDGDVEVIVVPNGPDESWKAVAEAFKQDQRVQWHPIVKAHANVARNHGMRLAQGNYIRFLDDDDYFYSHEAEQQLVRLDSAGHDISQGGVNLVDSKGNSINTLPSSICDADFTLSMLLPTRITLPCSFIFNRKSIQSASWDQERNYSQDVDFALSLAGERDYLALRHDGEVAAWVQHAADRISSSVSSAKHPQAWASILMKTHENLQKRHAFNDKRQEALTKGVWTCIHSSFMLSPIFWTKFINNSPEFIKSSSPPVVFFQRPTGKLVSPIIWEWLMLPHRYLRHHIRSAEQQQ